MSRTAVTFTIRHFFEGYVKRTGNKSAITSKDHKAILDATGVTCREIILDDGGLKLFARLGSIVIKKVRPRGDKKAPIDFSSFSKENKKVYHFNDHSDGYIARILWERANNNCVLNDKHMWIFKPVRNFRRALCAFMKAGKQDYLILTK